SEFPWVSNRPPWHARCTVREGEHGFRVRRRTPMRTATVHELGWKAALWLAALALAAAGGRATAQIPNETKPPDPVPLTWTPRQKVEQALPAEPVRPRAPEP